MQNDMRNRLANLLYEAEGQVNNEYPTVEMIAERLIANGVIVLPCEKGDVFIDEDGRRCRVDSWRIACVSCTDDDKLRVHSSEEVEKMLKED